MKKKILFIVVPILVVLAILAALIFIPGTGFRELFIKKFKVGIVKDSTFGYYRAGTEELGGYSVDLATKAFESMGYRVEILLIEQKDAKELLKKGELDCLMDNTDTLGDEFIGSREYLSLMRGIMVKKELSRQINMTSDLSAYKGMAMAGDDTEAFLNENMLNAPAATFSDGVAALTKGEIDYFIADIFRIEQLTEGDEAYSAYTSGLYLLNQGVNIIFRAEDSALCEKTSELLEEYVNGGTISLLNEVHSLKGFTA